VNLKKRLEELEKLFTEKKTLTDKAVVERDLFVRDGNVELEKMNKDINELWLECGDLKSRLDEVKCLMK